MPKPIQLTINGEPRQVDAKTVLGLLEELALDPRVTLVELNAGIVDRASYAQTALNNGDILELVRLVGGG